MDQRSRYSKQGNCGIAGFSLLEVSIVLAVTAIIVGFSIPGLSRLIRHMRYVDYTGQTEYLAKYAKLYAMERTTNVGICFGTTQIDVRDLGTSRSADICTAGAVIRTLTIPTAYTYLTFSGNNASFDPRGLAITTGNLCTAYGASSTNICIGRTRINKIEATGACNACP